jgi:hypothetical protein
MYNDAPKLHLPEGLTPNHNTQQVTIYRGSSRLQDLSAFAGLSLEFVDSDESQEAVALPASEVLKRKVASNIKELHEVGIAQRISRIEKVVADRKIRYIAYLEEIEREALELFTVLERIESELPGAVANADSSGQKLGKSQKEYDGAWQYRQLALELHHLSDEESEDEDLLGTSRFINAFTPDVARSLHAGSGNSWFEAKEQEIGILTLLNKTACDKRDALIVRKEEIVAELNELIVAIAGAKSEHEGVAKDYQNAETYLQGKNPGKRIRRTRAGTFVISRLFGEKTKDSNNASARHRRKIDQGVDYGN